MMCRLQKGRKAFQSLLAEDEAIIEKTTKKGVRRFDIRPGIFGADCKAEKKGIKFFVTLAAGSAGNVSPRDFLKAMGIDHRYALYHRVDIYYEFGGSYLPLNHSTRAV